MKVLITGGAGFIGSHLAQELLEQNHEVIVIDDLSTGTINNIEHLKPNESFHYVVDTIFNVPLTAELVDKSDIIYHLAAAVGVFLIVKDPVKTIKINVRGTEILLDLANKKKKKVIIASSSEVYGKSNKFPLQEEGDLVFGTTQKVRWSYACSKAIDEFLALAYYRQQGLPTIIVRLFNTVGPRQTGRYGMVIPRFVEQALNGEPITVYGTGKQTRCFSHVSDVVTALVSLATANNAVGEIINIGSDEEVSIEKLAHIVKHIANSTSPIKYIPYDQAYDKGFEDLIKRVPDLEKARRLINYTRNYNIEDIVRAVVAYETESHVPSSLLFD